MLATHNDYLHGDYCVYCGVSVMNNSDWLKCDECETVFFCEDIYKNEVYCEDCGTHFAGECPACGQLVDVVFNTVDEPE